MGIQHFSDLKPRQALEFLQQEWHIQLKLDGSFIQFGVDDAGNFFTSRKQGERYYAVDEWPDMPWCNSFRAAHAALEGAVDGMLESGAILPGDTLSAEIMWGKRPNTILYKGEHNSIVITQCPQDTLDTVGLSHSSLSDSDWMLTYFGATATASTWHTPDGIHLHKKLAPHHWKVGVLHTLKAGTGAELNPSAARFVPRMMSIRKDLENWLHLGSKHEGASILDLLEFRNNVRPAFVPESMWRSPAVGVLKAQLRHDRDTLLQMYKSMMLAFSERATLLVAELCMLRPRHDYEGFVVKSGPLMAKLVHRDDFTHANKVSHWIRYVLQGGTRRRKPCFLSRTQNWSVERRLARLETLRCKYMRYRTLLTYHGRGVSVSYADQELHQRTLLLFAELRQRITHGW